MPNLIGTAPNQVPTNADLGSMAFEDSVNYNKKTSGNVIDVNTSTDALRITQTGAGNALVVEDSANPDSTPFVVTTDGTVVIGKTSIAADGRVQIVNSADSNAGFTLDFNKDRVGSIVQSGDQIGLVRFVGFDGSNYRRAATIESWVDGTPGTNDMPGRLVFSTTADGASSPTERMRIDNAGNVGIGVAPSAGRRLTVAGNITGSTASNGIISQGTIQSDVTSSTSLFSTFPATQATTFTLSALNHYLAVQGTIGAGSSVTNQYGFNAQNTLTGATNNYGFYSNIASGTGRYNFYAAGSADNYFAGKVGIGTASTLSGVVTVEGANTVTDSWGQLAIRTSDVAAIDKGALIALGGKNGVSTNSSNFGTIAGRKENATDGNSAGYLAFGTTTSGNTNVERMRIDSSGNVIHTAPTTAPTLSTDGTMVFNLTSNTNLRVSVRGSDGVTRTANITLA